MTLPRIWLALAFSAILLGPSLPSVASAQDMSLALSRLRVQAAEGSACSPTFNGGLTRQYCADNDAWTRVMTQFAGSMLPPALVPAGTRGVRGIYIGFETWYTGIDNDAEYWHRAVEGDGIGDDTSRSRFVDPVLAWGRLNVRKGLPLGFDLGTSIGYLANTNYWSLGLEVRWALFEGFRDGVGWLPDLAVRGAAQTLIGDGEFNMTVPSVDLILSEPFVVASSVEITPYLLGQVAWVFADSELVDLTPEQSPFAGCNPSPITPTVDSGAPPYCRSDGSDLNHDVVFPSLRSMRARVGGGIRLRYQWFTLTGSFIMDAVNPGTLDSNILDLVDGAGPPKQWQLDLGLGLSL